MCFKRSSWRRTSTRTWKRSRPSGAPTWPRWGWCPRPGPRWVLLGDPVWELGPSSVPSCSGSQSALCTGLEQWPGVFLSVTSSLQLKLPMGSQHGATQGASSVPTDPPFPARDAIVTRLSLCLSLLPVGGEDAHASHVPGAKQPPAPAGHGDQPAVSRAAAPLIPPGDRWHPTPGSSPRVSLPLPSLHSQTRRPVCAHVQAKKCISAHLGTLADFAIEMFDVLDEINYQSYNDFVLRVGTWSSVRPLGPAPPSPPAGSLGPSPRSRGQQARPPGLPGGGWRGLEGRLGDAGTAASETGCRRLRAGPDCCPAQGTCGVSVTCRCPEAPPRPR